MYWYKVKTLLIGLFAAINIFLIIFIVQGKVREELFEKKETESLINVLSINNISVDESVFSQKAKPVKTALAENLIPSGSETAKIMLGENFAAERDESGIEKYKSDGKVVYTENGRFFYSDENLKCDQKLTDDKIAVAAELLKKYNIDISAAAGKIVGEKIVFEYKFDNLPLFENTLYVKMSGEALCEIGGYIIGFKDEGKAESEIAEPSHALMAFLRDESRGDDAQKILSVELGYSLFLTDTSVNFKMAEIIPTYKIKTDKNGIYYYDARR